MRFYVPGMKEKEKDGSDVENAEEDEEEQSEEVTAASVFISVVLF